jgi:hypothetical protein
LSLEQCSYYYYYFTVRYVRYEKGNGNTATLLFSLKGLEILHQERRGQVETIVMEHFNSILFHRLTSLVQKKLITVRRSGGNQTWNRTG